jgi:vitamin B12 transporter
MFTAFCLLTTVCPRLVRAQTTPTEDSDTSQTPEKKTKPENRKEKKKAEAEQPYNMQPVVVTATKTAVPLSATTKDVSVVTGKDMQILQQVSIPEALDTVPGVTVQNQGGPGQYTNVNIRGLGSQYTQFQYNGFPLRDAADTQGSLQYLDNDLFGQSGISRIEVLNGANSVLYGSSAIGGVVNIIPQKWGCGFTGDLMSEIGPDDTYVENGGVSYGNDKYYINFNPTYITTNGISNGGPNSYWYHNFSFNGDAGVRFGDNMSLELFNLTSSADLALSSVYPSLNAQLQLIPNQASSTDHVESLIQLTGVTFRQQVSPLWDYSVKYAYGNTERQYFQPDVYAGAPGSSDLDGTTNWLEMQHNLHPTRWLTLTGGGDFDQASYSSSTPQVANYLWSGSYTSTSKEWYGYDLFGEAQTAFFDKSLLINAGLRFNDHQQFASKVVEEVSAAYIFKQTGTKIHSAFGTGYRTPSLYEIYGDYVDQYSGRAVTVGNPNLQPERSTSYEAGISQPLFNNRVNMDLTWFHMDVNNIIYYDLFQNTYLNGSTGRTSGIEASIKAKPSRYLRLGASYTYAFAQYKPEGAGPWERQNYVPMNTLAFLGAVYPVDRLRVSFKVLWEGDRIVPLYDQNFDQIYWKEPSDIRVDMIVNYKIVENYEGLREVDLFMKITNLLNEHYTEYGYQMPGQWIWGGVRMSF